MISNDRGCVLFIFDRHSYYNVVKSSFKIRENCDANGVKWPW